MCDASDYAIGAILGQRDGKNLNVIQYASQLFNDDQKNYATTEKEFHAIVFACDKFRSYIINSKVKIHTDHQALRHLLAKKDALPGWCFTGRSSPPTTLPCGVGRTTPSASYADGRQRLSNISF
jgi:hypothetical protein